MSTNYQWGISNDWQVHNYETAHAFSSPQTSIFDFLQQWMLQQNSGPAISRFLLQSSLYCWPVHACTISSFISIQKQCEMHNFSTLFLLKRATGVLHVGLDLSEITHRDLKITCWQMTSSHECNICFSKSCIHDSKIWCVRIVRGHRSSKTFV